MAEQGGTEVFVSLLRITEFLITFLTELTRELVWSFLIGDEHYDLHLSLGKNLVNFDSSKKEDYSSLSSLNFAHQRNLDKKLSMLLKKQIPSQNIINKNLPDNFIVNFSSHNLTTQQSRVLELGLNVSQNSKPSIPKLIASIESFF